MVKWKFDNDYIKRNYSDKLKDMWRKVITTSTPDLTIEVYYPKPRCWYEQMKYLYDENNQRIHWHKNEIMYATMILRYPLHEMTLVRPGNTERARGLYCYRWQYNNRLIKLFYTEETSDYWIAFIMAHEYRHYRQHKKYGSAMRNYENGRLRRPIQIEKDADSWAYKRVKELGLKR